MNLYKITAAAAVLIGVLLCVAFCAGCGTGTGIVFAPDGSIVVIPPTEPIVIEAVGK